MQAREDPGPTGADWHCCWSRQSAELAAVSGAEKAGKEKDGAAEERSAGGTHRSERSIASISAMGGGTPGIHLLEAHPPFTATRFLDSEAYDASIEKQEFDKREAEGRKVRERVLVKKAEATV